ncbi:MAG: isoprenyl transferase [Crocinitomicaceae bacterium]|nr:isoprenyl transferase [Crocinitomicaceae bacterium]|tara:strand:+ start:149 stop:922 length:774 start_codon:yes stop_codon:yes gene_type:complete
MTALENEQLERCVEWGLDHERIPKHVAIIMDGNGRWANERGESRVFGHMNGIDSVRASVEAALELGVKHLTLYAFSTENWNRPVEEVNALMDLLVETLVKEVEALADKGVRLRTIGDTGALPASCQAQLKLATEQTAHQQSLDLILALSYSSKWEMVEAVKSVMLSGIRPEEVDAQVISDHLTTRDLPDPELMIRTSGERRISNFLLWQMAYTEFHFSPVLWPDFGKDEFIGAIRDFQNRERRFGGLLDTNHNVESK